MEQQQIGKFIQALRKEKELTQKDLAQMLGVTDRAISKWENGRGMPDVSLMKPLCDILGITINELLSGERIDQKDYQEKSEFNFLNTMDISNKKIQKKNTLLRIVLAAALLLAVGVWLLVYLLPVTRYHFLPEEELEIFYVQKTLPVAPEGEPLIRYTSPDFQEQDITERIDLEKLKTLLPLMRVTVCRSNVDRFWVGDITYEIFGYFKSGPRAGKTFEIRLGEGPTNYLQAHGSNRRYGIMDSHAWIEMMEMLEGWEKPNREYFQWDQENIFSIYYQGKVHSGQGMLLSLPEDALWIGGVKGISATPDEELECSFSTQAHQVYQWQADGKSYLAVQVAHDKAYGIPVVIS